MKGLFVFSFFSFLVSISIQKYILFDLSGMMLLFIHSIDENYGKHYFITRIL